MPSFPTGWSGLVAKTDGGASVLIGEAKMLDTVAAAIKGFTCAMVLLVATDMVEEGEGMTSVGNGCRWGWPAVSSATWMIFRRNQQTAPCKG